MRRSFLHSFAESSSERGMSWSLMQPQRSQQRLELSRDPSEPLLGGRWTSLRCVHTPLKHFAKWTKSFSFTFRIFNVLLRSIATHLYICDSLHSLSQSFIWIKFKNVFSQLKTSIYVSSIHPTAPLFCNNPFYVLHYIETNYLCVSL